MIRPDKGDADTAADEGVGTGGMGEAAGRFVSGIDVTWGPVAQPARSSAMKNVVRMIESPSAV